MKRHETSLPIIIDGGGDLCVASDMLLARESGDAVYFQHLARFVYGIGHLRRSDQK